VSRDDPSHNKNSLISISSLPLFDIDKKGKE
jgi:hypothetical protein